MHIEVKNKMKPLVEANTVEALVNLGFTEEFLSQTDLRELRLSRVTGLPVLEERPSVEVSSISLQGAIYSYILLECKEDKTFFIAIGANGKTFYVALRKRKPPVIFYAPYKSETIKSAVLNLLKNNLLKGPNFYSRTSRLIPGLFGKLLCMVYKEEEGPVSIPMVVKARKNIDVESIIVFSSRSPHSTSLIIGEVYHPFDINHFPREQVNPPKAKPVEKTDGGIRRGELDVRSAKTPKSKSKLSQGKLDELLQRFPSV